MRPSRRQLTVRWTILLTWVVGLDAAAANWIVTVRKPIETSNIGMSGGVYRGYRGYDGSQVSTFRNLRSGKTTVHWVHPPTATGRCYVWWPSVAGGVFTLVALALAATRNGRRLIADLPLPRMTTRRLMIAVAVIAIEAMLIINMSGKLGGDPRSSGWPAIIIGLAAPPTLVFLRAFGRTRSTGVE